MNKKINYILNMNTNQIKTLTNNKESGNCSSCGYSNVTGATKCASCGKGILFTV